MITTASELAWAAGFLDGEGYFGIPRDHTRGPCIEAAQVATDAPLRRLQALFGGSVRRSRGVHHWRLTGAPGVSKAVAGVGEFLCVKQREAEIVLAYAALFGRRGTQAIAPEVRLMRETLRVRLVATRAAA